MALSLLYVHEFPLESLLTISWISMSAIALVSAFPFTALQALTKHGKMVPINIEGWLVPKCWFYHFYIYALIVSLLLRSRSQLCTVLLSLHLTRRLIEQVALFPYGKHSRMHITAYLFGFVFYSAVAVTLPQQPLSVQLFIAGNVLQFLSHRALYLHRSRMSGNRDAQKKTVPKSILFRYMNCPHYFAEMLIYVSLVSISSSASIALTLFVIVSLGVNWRNHSIWYSEQKSKVSE